MNKRLKFLVAITLIFAIFVSSCVVPAASFSNDVETSTRDMILINMDTDTIVFSERQDNKWYLGYLTKLMTLLLSYEKLSDPKSITFPVEQAYLDALPYSDGCLKKYVGKTLTAYDLMAILILTTGSDAAYALADLSSGGDIDAFVAEMNTRSAELGCENTKYVSPGYSSEDAHHTTCRELYYLYRAVSELDIYQEITQVKTYTPEGLDNANYFVSTEVSILNERSPYYFRYVTDAQYSYTDETNAGIVLTTTYRGMTYFFAGIRGLNESEKNIYADARKLTTWAYLNLSDRKIFNAEDTMSSVAVQTSWGGYTLDLYPANSAFKTLPNDYDEEKLDYTFDIPETAQTPLLRGQAVGTAKILYDGEEVDNIELISDSDEGLGILSDTARFGNYVFSKLIPDEKAIDEDALVPETDGADETAAATEG